MEDIQIENFKYFIYGYEAAYKATTPDKAVGIDVLISLQNNNKNSPACLSSMFLGAVIISLHVHNKLAEFTKDKIYNLCVNELPRYGFTSLR